MSELINNCFILRHKKLGCYIAGAGGYFFHSKGGAKNALNRLLRWSGANGDKSDYEIVECEVHPTRVHPTENKNEAATT